MHFQLINTNCFEVSPTISYYVLPDGDALHDEIVRGQRAGLVEAANVDLARERNSEGLRAEHA